MKTSVLLLKGGDEINRAAELLTAAGITVEDSWAADLPMPIERTTEIGEAVTERLEHLSAREQAKR